MLIHRRLPSSLLSPVRHQEIYKNPDGSLIFTETDVRMCAYSNSVADVKKLAERSNKGGETDEVWAKMTYDLPYPCEDTFYSGDRCAGNEIVQDGSETFLLLELIGAVQKKPKVAKAIPSFRRVPTSSRSRAHSTPRAASVGIARAAAAAAAKRLRRRRRTPTPHYTFNGITYVLRDGSLRAIPGARSSRPSGAATGGGVSAGPRPVTTTAAPPSVPTAAPAPREAPDPADVATATTGGTGGVALAVEGVSATCGPHEDLALDDAEGHSDGDIDEKMEDATHEEVSGVKETEKTEKMMPIDPLAFTKKPEAVEIQDDNGRILAVTQDEAEALARDMAAKSLVKLNSPRKRSNLEITQEEGDFYKNHILPYEEDSLVDLPLDDFDDEMSAVQKSIPSVDDQDVNDNLYEMWAALKAKKLKFDPFSMFE